MGARAAAQKASKSHVPADHGATSHLRVHIGGVSETTVKNLVRVQVASRKAQTYRLPHGTGARGGGRTWQIRGPRHRAARIEVGYKARPQHGLRVFGGVRVAVGGIKALARHTGAITPPRRQERLLPSSLEALDVEAMSPQRLRPCTAIDGDCGRPGLVASQGV